MNVRQLERRAEEAISQARMLIAKARRLRHRPRSQTNVAELPSIEWFADRSGPFLCLERQEQPPPRESYQSLPSVGAMDLDDDDEVEATVRDLIAQHLSGDARKAALDWLHKRVATYRTIQRLSPLDDD